MEWKVNPNAVNQVANGTRIYSEGEPVYSISLLLKGRVLIHNGGAKITVNSGSFLGIIDLYEGRYLSSYTALDDVVLYNIIISQKEELEVVLESNKEYGGLIVSSMNQTIASLDQVYQGLYKQGTRLYNYITDTYKKYKEVTDVLGYKGRSSERLETISIIKNTLEVQREKINYYKECKSIPIDVVKPYFSHGNSIALYQIEDQANLVLQQLTEIREISKEVISMVEGMIDESDSSLFYLYALLALEIKNANGNASELMNIIDSLIEEINTVDTFYERMMDHKFNINRIRMEEMYHRLLIGNKEKELNIENLLLYSKNDAEQALNDTNNSFQKLLTYSEVDTANAEEMKTCLMNYMNLKDRFSGDDSTRSLRRHLAEHFYVLYHKVFLKAYKEKNVPRIIDMFLKYGFAEERLLTKDQLITLYYLKEEEQQSPCNVYSIKDWLTLVYEGVKEPSKNEFDLEYPEMVMSLRKQGKLNEQEAKQWLNNQDMKLDYEIQNMFRYNNRLINGQVSTFVPILQKDMLPNKLEKLLVTPTRVNQTIKELLKIDYSAFDREIIYMNKEKKIPKEYIVKSVYPDIILMPTAGSNGIMWQDISAKKRDNAGRFLLPIFCDTNLKPSLVKLIGRFRWELCRTLEGSGWNDIKHKSLTSEYSDYIQFYKKNKELSEDKKEKVRLQIQKGHSNMREIFVIDYEHWINYESNGSIKLNKPVREMLATYCPFSKDIRDRIMGQPMFSEAYARYLREKMKKIKEIEARYRLLQKDRIELTSELIDTLNYYRDM